MFLNYSLILLTMVRWSTASPIGHAHPASSRVVRWHGSTPQLPATGGDTQLPGPSQDAQLVQIALGFGIQNYTCAEAGSLATGNGALATLYDITSFYPGQSRHSLSLKDFNSLTTKALATRRVPLNFDPSPEGRADPSHPGALASNPYPDAAPLWLGGVRRPIPFSGRHFFDLEGAPNFVLNKGTIHFRGKRDASVNAPASAFAGPDGTGAVSWLLLGDAGRSVGARFVYRLLTAGGVTHGCNGSGGDSTSYTATYWFYN